MDTASVYCSVCQHEQWGEKGVALSPSLRLLQCRGCQVGARCTGPGGGSLPPCGPERPPPPPQQMPGRPLPCPRVISPPDSSLSRLLPPPGALSAIWRRWASFCMGRSCRGPVLGPQGGPRRTSASPSRGACGCGGGAQPCPLPPPPIPQASLYASEHEEGPLGQRSECILIVECDSGAAEK